MIPTQEEFAARIRALRAGAEALGERMFLGLPDRWYEGPDGRGPVWRCREGHVSRRILKASEPPYDACLHCQSSVMMTFPEDEEWVE